MTNDDLQKWLGMTPGERVSHDAGEVARVIVALRSEILELHADKARLDFSQANHSWLTRSKDDAGTDHEWRVSLGMGQNTFDATTARGAIDAAMKEPQ